MFVILRQRNFRLLWIAGITSALGDWILAASLPFYIYALSGSALATGTMFMIEAIPRLAFGYLAGVFVDRWNRKWTMVIADGSRALLLVLLLLVHSPDYFWLIYLVAFIETTISLFFGPAKGAILPDLIDKEQELVHANSLGSLSDNICRLAGPALGGLLLALYGISCVVFVDILSYLISGTLLLCMSIPHREKGATTTSKAGKQYTSFWNDLFTGLKMLYKEQWLMLLCIVMGISIFGQGIINVLLVVFVQKILHGNAQQFGWIMSAQGVGGIIGGLTVGRIGKSLAPDRLLAVSLICLGLIFLTIINIPVYFLSLVLFALIGLPVVGWIVGASTLLQKGLDSIYRGRILGAYGTVQTIAILCGMATASFLGGSLGVIPTLNIAGGLILLSSIVAVTLLRDPKTITVSTTADRHVEVDKQPAQVGSEGLQSS